MKVPVFFSFDPPSFVIYEGDRMIQGWTTVIAQDTNAPVEGVAITAMLVNETGMIFTMTKTTDGDGVADYTFLTESPVPAFSDSGHWGDLTIEFSTDSEIIDPQDRIWLTVAHGGLNVTYFVEEDPILTQQTIAISGLVLIVAIAASFSGVEGPRGSGSSPIYSAMPPSCRRRRNKTGNFHMLRGPGDCPPEEGFLAEGL